MLDPKCYSRKEVDITLSVLNGIYPTWAIKRMTKTKLARLIYNLVQYTASIVGNKNKHNGLIRPVWWPNGIVFNNNTSLPNRISQNEMKVTLEQLVKCCTQFFKTTEIDYCIRKKSKESHGIRTRNRRKCQPYNTLVLSINKENIKKRQFLLNCGLQPKTSPICQKVTNNIISTPKLMNTSMNIPFSSDIGRLLLQKNNHQISEDVQLKRIEKNEWYINRTDINKTPIDIDYQFRPCRNEINLHYHTYKIPKRQFHQQRPNLHNPEFLKLFCKSVSVVLERVNLKKFRNKNIKQCENSDRNSIRLCDKRIPFVLLNNITNTKFYRLK